MINLDTFLKETSDGSYITFYGNQELYNLCLLTKIDYSFMNDCCKMKEKTLWGMNEIHYSFWDYWFDSKRFDKSLGKLLKSFVFFKTLCLRN